MNKKEITTKVVNALAKEHLVAQQVSVQEFDKYYLITLNVPRFDFGGIDLSHCLTVVSLTSKDKDA